MNSDTIFALSSGHGKSGVAVIRISGENLNDIFAKFINKSNIKPRHAYFTNLHDENNDLIDQCLAIYFPAPNSFTGEDVVEFHIDCLSTVTFCNKNARASGKVFSNNQKVIASIKIIRKLAKTCEVTFEKVRGHKSVMNPNTVVDRLAKLAIRRD